MRTWRSWLCAPRGSSLSFLLKHGGSMHGESCELDSFLTWTLLSVNVLTCFLSPSQTVHLAMLFFFFCAFQKGDGSEEGVTSEGKVRSRPRLRSFPRCCAKSTRRFTLDYQRVYLTEFDKFLEERAKVVDSIPSPLGPHPTHPARASAGSSKKAERTEDSLFAL